MDDYPSDTNTAEREERTRFRRQRVEDEEAFDEQWRELEQELLNFQEEIVDGVLNDIRYIALDDMDEIMAAIGGGDNLEDVARDLITATETVIGPHDDQFRLAREVLQDFADRAEQTIRHQREVNFDIGYSAATNERRLDIQRAVRDTLAQIEDYIEEVDTELDDRLQSIGQLDMANPRAG